MSSLLLLGEQDVLSEVAGPRVTPVLKVLLVEARHHLHHRAGSRSCHRRYSRLLLHRSCRKL